MTNCTHWWVIDTPNGALSAGRCKLCGAEGMFPNSGPGENLASWKDGGAGVLALRGTSLRRTRKGAK